MHKRVARRLALVLLSFLGTAVALSTAPSQGTLRPPSPDFLREAVRRTRTAGFHFVEVQVTSNDGASIGALEFGDWQPPHSIRRRLERWRAPVLAQLPPGQRPVTVDVVQIGVDIYRRAISDATWEHSRASLSPYVLHVLYLIERGPVRVRGRAYEIRINRRRATVEVKGGYVVHIYDGWGNDYRLSRFGRCTQFIRPHPGNQIEATPRSSAPIGIPEIDAQLAREKEALLAAPTKAVTRCPRDRG
jgi:hypothetical protein